MEKIKPLRPRSLPVLTVALIGFWLSGVAFAAKDKPPVPDLTSGGTLAGDHDWNLGPSGLRGNMWAWSMVTTDSRQIQVTKVDKGSPADGIVFVGDVILGTGSNMFTSDARVAFGHAITVAETEAVGGKLPLLLWREGTKMLVTVPLRVMGSYSEQTPFGGCEKSKKIIEMGVAHLAKHIGTSISEEVNALALLATGDKKYLPILTELARKVGPNNLTLDDDRGMVAWHWGYDNLFLTEYCLATQDKEVLPAIEAYSHAIARGQSGVGTWGHGMAWPEQNNGRPHGPLGGYGALNQAGLVCQLSMVLALKCGVKNEEVTKAVANGNRFFEFYINKGTVPYGDHNPGSNHAGNGKNGIAAVMFDGQDRIDGAAFFSRMVVASYGEREMGHTGNYFSYLWGALGAARAGPAATTAFLKELRWYYELARRWDGTFPYQGADKSDAYNKWDCTGAYLLAYLLPGEKLYITGKGRHKEAELTGAALADTVEAGRGFVVPERGITPYLAKSKEALVKDLTSWSPAVRERASEALTTKSDDAVVQTVIKMLSAKEANTRYGACVALGALKAAPAVQSLTETLVSDDVWLRIQATYALSAIGNPARPSASKLLDLAVASDPNDPREFTQRYIAYALFYPGGAMGKAGLFANSIAGIDRQQLYAAAERLLNNDDGRARGTVTSIYDQLTYDEIKPLLQAIHKSIVEQSPSGEMFASGVRLRGLELFAKYRIEEGMPLCIQVMDIDKWGKNARIPQALKILDRYGAAAKVVLPQLRELEKELRTKKEKSMAEHANTVAATIQKLEASPDDTEPLLTLDFPKNKVTQ
ncbi:MAG: acetylesterase [Planctomycetota bacterium]|nr:MAG: acetylesterase [Planctomycetota bacterium]